MKSKHITKERVCPVCGKTHVRRQNPCQVCATARGRRTNREKRLNNTNMIYEHIGTSGCVKCGNTDRRVHVFHHVDSTTKLYNISEILLKPIDVVLREVDKCILLCANCHIIHHYEVDYIH